MPPADSLSRRNFLKLTGGAAALAAVGHSVAGAAEQPANIPPVRAGRNQPRRFTIDCHLHYQERPYYFESMVTFYKERNAMGCCNGWRAQFPAIVEAAKKHPDVVIPFGRISVDDANVLSDLDYFAANGAKGIKLRDPRYNWDDERYFPIYERIQKHGLVGLYHTGIAGFGTLGFPRMRPEYLLTIAAKFPDYQIICGHFGNPWYAEAAEVVRWCKNVHCDITGSTLTKLQGRLAEVKQYLWWEGPSQHSAPDTVYAFEKLVFGTDEPPERIDNMLSRTEDMLEACQVPEDTRRRIYGGTMAKLLKIPARS
jgi:predicted TIM-barrel fold metal-dependent hydrolase